MDFDESFVPVNDGAENSPVLAPYWGGRVQLRSTDGWTWWQKAEADAAGWYWWDERFTCLKPALDFEVEQHFPLKSLEKLEGDRARVGSRSVPLRLAEGQRPGDWLRAWWDGATAWAVAPASGPSQPRPNRERAREIASPAARRPAPAASSPQVASTRDIEAAVRRGGGQMLRATPTPAGFNVDWERSGIRYSSQVDRHLNILRAGFCLSGQDRIQDLTTLVSLVEGRESHHADPRVWRGDSGW